MFLIFKNFVKPFVSVVRSVVRAFESVIDTAVDFISNSFDQTASAPLPPSPTPEEIAERQRQEDAAERKRKRQLLEQHREKELAEKARLLDKDIAQIGLREMKPLSMRDDIEKLSNNLIRKMDRILTYNFPRVGILKTTDPAKAVHLLFAEAKWDEEKTEQAIAWLARQQAKLQSEESSDDNRLFLQQPTPIELGPFVTNTPRDSDQPISIATPTATPSPEQLHNLEVSQQIVGEILDPEDTSQYDLLLQIVQNEVGPFSGEFTEEQARVITWVILNNIAWTRSGDQMRLGFSGSARYDSVRNVAGRIPDSETLPEFEINQTGGTLIKASVDRALEEFFTDGYRTTTDPSQGSIEWRHFQTLRADRELNIDFFNRHQRTFDEFVENAERIFGVEDYLITIPPALSLEEMESTTGLLATLYLFGPNDPCSFTTECSADGSFSTRNIGGIIYPPINSGLNAANDE